MVSGACSPQAWYPLQRNLPSIRGYWEIVFAYDADYAEPRAGSTLGPVDHTGVGPRNVDSTMHALYGRISYFYVASWIPFW